MPYLDWRHGRSLGQHEMREIFLDAYRSFVLTFAGTSVSAHLCIQVSSQECLHHGDWQMLELGASVLATPASNISQHLASTEMVPTGRVWKMDGRECRLPVASLGSVFSVLLIRTPCFLHLLLQ